MFKVKINIRNGEVVVYSNVVEDLEFSDKEKATKFGEWFKEMVEFFLQNCDHVKYSYEVIEISIDGEYPVENTETPKEDNRCKLGKNRDLDDCNGCLCDQCYGNQINGPIGVCANCNRLIEDVKVLRVKRIDCNYYCPCCSYVLFNHKGDE